MIITRLQGGLGNQMFQYAAGLALAEHRRTVLKLDVSWFREYAEHEAHNRYALSCFNITEQFATQEEVDRVAGVKLTRLERWSVAFAKRLHFYRYARRHIGPSHIHYETREAPERFFNAPDPTYLYGMWQSERYFASVGNLLRLHFSFRYPPQPAVSAIAERIRREGPSVAVHFRRGDYVHNTAFNERLGVLSADYYERAIARIREQFPDATLFIWSDDIEAVSREFRPPGSHVFVRTTQPWHSFDDMRLMSACDHAIISNSTFAWWAAWLNPSPSKIVIAPKLWRRSAPEEWRQAIPENWVAL
jgi:hypothetical protein